MENWKSVVGYEHKYLVSDLGRIKTDKNRILKPTRGGMYVSVFDQDGTKKHLLIAKAVLDTFYGERHDCNIKYIDGDKNNLVLANLTWVKKEEYTNIDNNVDIERVRAIKCFFYSGTHISRIASIYGVSVGYIKNVLFNKKWANVEIPGTKIVDNNGCKIPKHKLPPLAYKLKMMRLK